MKFRKASSLFLAGAMCLSTFGGAMSVFADEETSSEAAEAETVDYSAEDPITATITVWGTSRGSGRRVRRVAAEALRSIQ